MKFEDLPIMLDEIEYKDEWSRVIKKEGTVADLLKLWNIDDPVENSAMAQVLRHLRFIMSGGLGEKQAFIEGANMACNKILFNQWSLSTLIDSSKIDTSIRDDLEIEASTRYKEKRCGTCKFWKRKSWEHDFAKPNCTKKEIDECGEYFGCIYWEAKL